MSEIADDYTEPVDRLDYEPDTDTPEFPDDLSEDPR